MDDLQKAQPRKPNIFGEVYRPPPAGYTRETGNKHIKSLMSAATPAAPQPLILPPPTTITPRPVTMATQKPAKPAKSKTRPGIEDYSTPYVPPVPDATEKEAQKEEQATQKHLAPLQGTSQTSPALVTAEDADGREVLSIPGLGEFRVDRDIPLPSACRRVAKNWPAVLLSLKPGASTELPINSRSMLIKHMTQLHKGKQGSWTHQVNKDKTKLRVWRIA